MSEHRSVGLPEDVLAYLDDEIWPNADDVVVESGMMQLAQREAIGDDRLATRLSIGDDVGRVEQFLMPELTQGASTPVRGEDALAKPSLMQSLPDDVEGI